MILSNVEILRCLEEGLFSIRPLAGNDPLKSPFNTTAVDLRLGNEILVPDGNAPIQLDLRKSGMAQFWARHSQRLTIIEQQPFSLNPRQLIIEEVKGFPANAPNQFRGQQNPAGVI